MKEGTNREERLDWDLRAAPRRRRLLFITFQELFAGKCHDSDSEESNLMANFTEWIVGESSPKKPLFSSQVLKRIWFCESTGQNPLNRDWFQLGHSSNVRTPSLPQTRTHVFRTTGKRNLNHQEDCTPRQNCPAYKTRIMEFLWFKSSRQLCAGVQSSWWLRLRLPVV